MPLYFFHIKLLNISNLEVEFKLLQWHLITLPLSINNTLTIQFLYLSPNLFQWSSQIVSLFSWSSSSLSFSFPLVIQQPNLFLRLSYLIWSLKDICYRSRRWWARIFYIFIYFFLSWYTYVYLIWYYNKKGVELRKNNKIK